MLFSRRPEVRLPLLVLALGSLAALSAAPSRAESSAAATRCQQALQRHGATLVERELGSLRTCTATVFACVQQDPGNEACLVEARALCARELGWIAAPAAGPAGDFAGQAGPSCADVDVEQMVAADGLGHGLRSCAAYDLPQIAAREDVLSCVSRQHFCRAAELLSAAVPRAAELLRLGGIDSAAIPCLADDADGAGRGLASRAASAGSEARERRSVDRDRRGAATVRAQRRSLAAAGSASTCQEAIGWAGQWFVRDYLKFLKPCLDAAWSCLAAGDGDPACRAAAAEVCTVQLERIRGAERSVASAFAQWVASSCGASKVPASHLLGATGLGFTSRTAACATLGVGGLEDADDVARCVLAAHDCAAQRIAAREVPRIDALLALGGLDPASFGCLVEEGTGTCGDGVLDAGEACDPPGSFAGCGTGEWCSRTCICLPSRAPVIAVEGLEYAVAEGGTLTIPVTASDPDGEPVTISAGPLVSGASFTALPGTAATGTLVVTPDFDAAGPHAVTFTARDPNGMTDSKTVWITVQHVGLPPVLTVDPTATVAEGGLLTLLVRASDPDDDPLTFTVQPDPLPANAVFIPATGTLTFAPDFDQSGAYEFTFAASDGTATTEPATCRVTVTDTTVEDPEEPVGLTLEVDRPQSPTLLATARITGRVNAVTGDPPAPDRATSALITSLGETQAEQGATLDVPLGGATCCGWATHFENGVSSASFGDGVTVLALGVAGPASATATIAIDAAATPGTRQVTVQTGNETAVSTIAFRIVAGRARVHGTVVDAASNRPIAGARVTVEGTAFHSTTGADGAFLLEGLPGGRRALLVGAQNHLLATFPIDAPVGVTTETGLLPLQPTVVDPTQPASVSLFSVLGRGIADLAGQPAIDAAKDVVRDALLLVGGDEVGVLDAYGNQQNPRVTDGGLFSLRDAGIELYAARMAAQDSTSLLEVLGQLSFGFRWNGAPPTVTGWLAALQREVDAAWARPNDEASAYWILLFNAAAGDGKRLSPNPPALAGETRLSKFQAYVAITGFIGAFSRNQDGWATGSSTLGGTFTGPWARLVDRFPVKPLGPNWSTPAEQGAKTNSAGAKDGGAKDGGGESALPDFEALIRSYYLDQSEDALVKVRELLLATFPGIGLEQHFEDNPLGVKEALDKLIVVAAGDVAIRNELVRVTSRNADGSSSQQNLWSLFDIEQGPLNDFVFGAEFLGSFTMWPRLVQRSWAPNAPYIFSARETTRTLGELSVPAVRVLFRPTISTDEGDYFYRLWRIVHDPKAETFRDPGNKPHASMVLVGFGALGSGEPLAPQALGDGSGRVYFELLLPPYGMNQYRMDVVRWVRLGGTTSVEDIQKAGPWMAGYLDDPLSTPAFPGFGQQHMHMGTYYLHGDRIDVSPLSNAAAVYIGGQGTGLAQYGRIDLAADPDDPSKVFVSIPGFKVDENEYSRATGSILRFDSAKGEAEEYVRPGFMIPGQIGIAIDEFGNLFTDNAASDDAYGGRVFRFLGPRESGDPVFDPAYPTAGPVPEKWFAGSVNYYSRMIQRANPASVQSMVMGPARRSETGQELYVVDLMSQRIKTIAVHGAEQKGWDPWHVAGQDWAWTKPDASPAPPARDQLGFGPETDMAWSPAFGELYLTCGSRVVRTSAGENQSRSITEPSEAGGTAETIFQLASGVAFCDAGGEQILFVSDKAAGAIYRIPVASLPLKVPDDAVARKALLDRYLFLTGIDRPGQLRITDRGAAMVYTDSTGVRYQKFGFTGRATDAGGTPLVGALVTVASAAGTQTTTSDADGYYSFLERTPEPVLHATVQHERATYVDRVTLTGRCNATLVSTPCVVITSPAHGAVVTTETVTVRGTILPRSADFTGSAPVLEVTGAAGLRTFPLAFTGAGNDFVVPNVALGEGDNALVVRTPALSGFAAGGSLVTAVRRDATPSGTQAAAGLLLDADSNPRGRVTLEVLVDGVAVTRTETDPCGYWSARNLPPGEVTVRETRRVEPAAQPGAPSRDRARQRRRAKGPRRRHEPVAVGGSGGAELAAVGGFRRGGPCVRPRTERVTDEGGHKARPYEFPGPNGRRWPRALASAMALLLALAIPAFAQSTRVTVTSPAGSVSQDLPAAGGAFSLGVPLAKNSVNRVVVTATDALGHTASRDVLITQVSLDSVVVAEVTVEELTPEEIEDLVNQGVIDLADPENYNVSEFTIVITIGGQPVEISVPVAIPIDDEDSGGDAPMPMPDADNAGGTPPPAPREILVLLDEIAGPGLPEPVPLPGVLIIEGRIKSLKEFFAIRLLLLNTSGIFTLSNVNANIEVPAGALKPVLPSTGVVAYGDILPGDGGAPGQSERQFIVRGDLIGTHEVRVNFGGVLTGPGIPEDEPIPFNGRTRATVQVKGPPTFQVQVFHPDQVYANEPYDLRVDITNTGDMPALYASLDLDVGADGKLVHCTTVPPENEPECEEVPGPETRSLGHIYPGKKVSQTFTVEPSRTGPVTSCVGASDQNVSLQVLVGAIGCLAGKYPPEDAGAAGPTVSVVPVGNALGVGVHAPVTAFFSTPIDTATITEGTDGTFRVFDGGLNLVPGRIRFTETFGRTVAIWQPYDGVTNALAPNTEFTVQLTQEIRDLAGRTLASPWVSTFSTTGDHFDDVTPPEITLTVQPPADPNDVIPGQIVLVDAYVVDQGSGVARVEARLKDMDDETATYQLIDQKSVFAGDRPPFLFAIDSGQLRSARHYQLLVTAYDAMANVQDGTISLVIGASAAPPSVTLPDDPGSAVLQGISLDVTPVAASDIVKEVRFYVDGAAEPAKTVTIAPWKASLQTLELSLGAHVVRAVAVDGLGRTGEDTLAFELAENRNMPVVGYGSAVDGAVYPAGAKFTVQGSATDPIGFRSILWYLDDVGAKSDALSSGTQPFLVDTAGLPDGAHRILGVATNRLGVTNDPNDPASVLLFQIVTPAGTTPPEPPVVASVAVPAGGRTTVAGTAPAGARVDVTNTRLGLTVSTFADAGGAYSAVVEAGSGDTLSLVVVDYRIAMEPSAPATAVVPAPPVLWRIEVAPDHLDFSSFSWADLTATAFYDDGSHADVTARARWTTGAAAVATVGGGRVVAHANGSTTIMAEFEEQSDTSAVTVAAVVLESISVEPPSVLLTAIGATQALSVVGHFSDGTNTLLTQQSSFSTADARIATVDAAGVVRAARRGATVVTVAHTGVAPVTVAVTVDTAEDTPPVATITSPPNGRQIERGDFVEIVVDAQDVDGGVTRVSVDASGETAYHDEHQVSPPALETTETFGFDVAADAEIGGTITVQAFARDTSAQSSPASTITLHVVDRTAPAVTVDAPAPDTIYLPASTVTVTISASDVVGVAEIRYETVGAFVTSDRRTYQPPVPSATEDFSFTLPPEITEGEVFIHGYAKDAAGNEGHAAAVRIVVQPDTTPPATRATAVSDPAGAATATVSFEITEGNDDIDHVELYFRRDGIGTFNRFTDSGRGNPEGKYAPAGGTILFDSTKTGGDGAYEFFTVGVDASGNREAPPTDEDGAFVPDQSAEFAAGTVWAVISTPTLLGAGDTTYDGSNVRVVGTTLTLDGHHAFRNLDLLNGALMTHPETTTAFEYGVDVSAFTITIDATSRIDVVARGYLGGGHLDNGGSEGRTRGNALGSTYRAGGSYGGPGAPYGGAPNATYGYVTDPVDLGSGGSSGGCGRGGDGGGRIAIAAINVASDGRIDATGEAVSGCQPGSGSGGAIKIVATTVSGRGAVAANGGAGEVGGGGGRVLIEYTDIATLETSLVRALGGHGNNAVGGNGSVTLRPLGAGTGTLIVDGQGTVSTWSPLGIPPGYVFDEIVLRNSARVLGDDPIVVNDALRIETGSILTHSLEREAGLSIAAKRVIVDATSAIDVTARGYRGGGRDGHGDSSGLTLDRQLGAAYRSGGSYGGRGADWGGAANPLYGHPANPVYLGSGGSSGGCGAGYNGGGRITIDASERVEVQGTVLAEGAGGGGCQPGSGSGGSIKVTTSLLIGNGRISADGGAGEVGGGGGRVAITYAHLGPEGANFDGTRSITAQGGHGNNAWGSAGTVLFKGPTQLYGDLYVDEKVEGSTSSSWSTLTRVGYGRIAALTEDTLTVDGQVSLLPGGLAGIEIAPNIERDTTFTIVSNTATTITVDVSSGTRLIDVAAAGDTYAAVYRFDNVVFRRGGHLNLGDRLIVEDTVRIDDHGLLTHYGATMATEPRLELRAGTIDVAATGRIDVTGRGYLGGGRDGNDATGQTIGNTDGSTYRAGGSHGGIGAPWGGTPNAPYGDQTDPDDLGAGGSSGGCGAGYNGGGRMRLRADRLVVDGALRADGNGGGGCQPGSGAGGTIHITAGELSGTGTISASGGGGEVGGGGGRIAIYYGTTTFPEANVYAVGGRGNNAIGGNGTVYLKDTHQAYGELIIDGHDAETPDYLSPIPAGAIYENLTLRNRARVTADAPLEVRGALKLLGASRLYHTAESEAGLTVHASTMTIDATSTVDVTGLGYPGGNRGSNGESYGLTLGRRPGATYRSGGSYGGYGAVYSGSGGNLPYGTPFDPRSLGAGGSSGGCGAGWNGGGLVRIQTDESLTVDGTIRADGTGGGGCQPGSGAGGSIRIETPLIRGTGSISANGGAGEVGGGGGRVRIDYTTWGEPGSDLGGNRSVAAFGGHGNNAWGSAGTVLLVREGQALGDLYVDDGVSAGTTALWTPLTPLGFGRSVFLTADTLTTDGAVPLVPDGLVGATINPNVAQATTFRVIANTANTLTVDVSGGTYLTDVAQPGDPYAAVWRFDNVTVRGGGYVVMDDLLKVDGTLALDERSVLTHRDATATWESRLDVDAARVVVAAGSSIDVSRRGYLGGGYAGNGNEGRTLGNVQGSTYRSAGSYGGLGGNFGGTPNPTYGNADDPNELGSGGSTGACGRGGDGGGLIRLHAGEIVLDGAILADGESITGCQPGSGSGGGIKVTVDGALSGTGLVRAAGGAGEVGGGGGRVAITAGSSTLPASNVTAPGGAGNNRSGEGGTVRTP